MIGDMIRERRLELEMTQLQLSELTGIKKNTISNYENNISAPTEENIIKLMDALKCDANYLFEWEEINNFTVSLSEKQHIKKYRTLDEYGKKTVDAVLELEHERCEASAEAETLLFRRLHENKASAGVGYDLNNLDEWRSIEVVDTAEARAADFAVEIDGHSMEPDYNDGDIVYIALANDIEVGQVGLFMQKGKGFIKEKGDSYLISRNPNYDDIYPDDGEITCIGRVIGVAELP